MKPRPKTQPSEIFLGSPLSPIGSPNLAAEVVKLAEENKLLQDEINKLTKESIIQRGKLFEEREALIRELEKVRNSSNSISVGTVDIKNMHSKKISFSSNI
jgi:chromosome condensin MukBEF MukE localization factor